MSPQDVAKLKYTEFAIVMNIDLDPNEFIETSYEGGAYLFSEIGHGHDLQSSFVPIVGSPKKPSAHF